MRIFLLALCTVCCGLIGVKIKSYYKKRSEIYEELHGFVRKVKTEISFKKNYLDDVLKGSDCSREVRAIVDGVGTVNALNEKERKEVSQIFQDIGKSDINEDILNLDKAIESLDNKSKLSQKEYSSKGVLAVKIGLLIGIGIFIIFV